MSDLARATHIEVEAGVRYWEDAEVNGVQDSDGTLIPGGGGDCWQAVIDLAAGRIEDWPAGTEARIHYKVCDQGAYWLLDADWTRVAKWAGHYVPGAFLCHGDNGFGDYIIMDVDPGGVIERYERPEIKAGEWLPATPEASS